MGSSGYGFGGYWKLGLPLSIIIMCRIVLIALFWTESKRSFEGGAVRLRLPMPQVKILAATARFRAIPAYVSSVI
jgi:hypothetical protein